MTFDEIIRLAHDELLPEAANAIESLLLMGLLDEERAVALIKSFGHSRVTEMAENSDA